MAEEKAVVEKKENLPVKYSFGIEGLVGFDRSDMPLPQIRLVQPTSQNVELEDGKEAAPGVFYYSRGRKVLDELHLVVLFAKKDHIQWEEGEVPTMVYRLLAIELGQQVMEPFEILVTGVSRWEWKRLLGQLVEANIGSIRDVVIKVTSERRERKQGGGKYYVMKFEISDPVRDADKKVIENLARSFISDSAEVVGNEDIAPEEIPF